MSTKFYLIDEVGLEFLINLFRLSLDDLDVFLHLLLGCLVRPAVVVLRADVSPQSPAAAELLIVKWLKSHQQPSSYLMVVTMSGCFFSIRGARASSFNSSKAEMH